MTFKLLHTSEKGEHTVAETTGFWRWLKTEVWVGKATVWHRVSDGDRAGVALEGRLSSYIWLLRYRGELA